MRTHRIVPTLVLATASGLVLALGACSGPDESAAASPTAKSSDAAAHEALLSEEDAVPSQEEADEAAEASISESNADAEMQKLEKELAEGGGG